MAAVSGRRWLARAPKASDALRCSAQLARTGRSSAGASLLEEPTLPPRLAVATAAMMLATSVSRERPGAATARNGYALYG
jgi:hypothetical protein